MSHASYVNKLALKLAQRKDDAVLWWQGREHTIAELLGYRDHWHSRFVADGVFPGTIVGYRGEYSPQVCALILALMETKAILVPFTRAVTAEMTKLIHLAGVNVLYDIAQDESVTLTKQTGAISHALIDQLRSAHHAGLIVFSSGSTGEPKGIVHDCERVLKKFETSRPGYRTLQFLLLDHFGGFNTLMAILSSGGVVIVVQDRTPPAVARLIAESRTELLPVTPTFLNMFIASGCHLTADMSSIKLVTYGTEVMPEETLRRARKAFPNARFQQTYGLSETGVLRSQSRNSESTWVKVGGQGFETKIIDKKLHIRSEFAMLGYLNAPSPFDAEGFLNTQDVVEQEGDWLRILGRTSDIINVGGQKVFPAEVETTLMAASNIIDAAVHGEKHPIMGSVVAATLTLQNPEDPVALRTRLRAHCREHLAAHKIPVKFRVVTNTATSDRFKKIRNGN